MKLINYFGEEFEREHELTNKELDCYKDRIEIYLAMGSKSDIDKILKVLTSEEARLVCRIAGNSYLRDRVRYASYY